MKTGRVTHHDSRLQLEKKKEENKNEEGTGDIDREREGERGCTYATRFETQTLQTTSLYPVQQLF